MSSAALSGTNRRMRLLAGLAAACLLALLHPVPAAASNASQSRTGSSLPAPTIITFEGRPVDIFAPSGPATAVVMLLHGYELTSASIEESSQLIQPGLKAGWLLVFPNGSNGSWDAGLCCGTAVTQKVDDVDYLVHLLASMRSTYHLAGRAPSIMGGFSNGAMMTEELMCHRPGLIDGAILMSGNLQDPRCTSARAKRILQIRGTQDTTVPIKGEHYSQFLATNLLPDSRTLYAATRGQTCASTTRTSHDKQTTDVQTTCSDGRFTYITEKGGHGWLTAHNLSGDNTTPVITAMIDQLM